MAFDLFSKDSYKQKYDVETRFNKCQYVKKKYPGRIPVIVEYSDDFPSKYRLLEKNKYLIPYDQTLCDFFQIIRRTTELEPHKGMTLITNDGYIPRANDTIQQIYEIHKDKDDEFLYFVLVIENVFG